MCFTGPSAAGRCVPRSRGEGCVRAPAWGTAAPCAAPPYVCGNTQRRAVPCLAQVRVFDPARGTVRRVGASALLAPGSVLLWPRSIVRPGTGASEEQHKRAVEPMGRAQPHAAADRHSAAPLAAAARAAPAPHVPDPPPSTPAPPSGPAAAHSQRTPSAFPQPAAACDTAPLTPELARRWVLGVTRDFIFVNKPPGVKVQVRRGRGPGPGINNWHLAMAGGGQGWPKGVAEPPLPRTLLRTLPWCARRAAPTRLSPSWPRPCACTPRTTPQGGAGRGVCGWAEAAACAHTPGGQGTRCCWRVQAGRCGRARQCCAALPSSLHAPPSRAHARMRALACAPPRARACRLVHRLDRNVSGVMALARSADAAAWLAACFRDKAAQVRGREPAVWQRTRACRPRTPPARARFGQRPACWPALPQRPTCHEACHSRAACRAAARARLCPVCLAAGGAAQQQHTGRPAGGGARGARGHERQARVSGGEHTRRGGRAHARRAPRSARRRAPCAGCPGPLRVPWGALHGTSCTGHSPPPPAPAQVPRARGGAP